MTSTRQAIPAAPPRERWSAGDAIGVAAALALVATLVVYHRGLRFPFALDDYTYLYQAAGIDPAPFELRRWLSVRAHYWLALHLFGLSPLPWHLMSFALHLSNSVWVYLLARRLGGSQPACWTASCLFACSPVAFTILYWVAGIQELSSGFFLLAAAYAALLEGRRRWWSVAFFALAMLCKESVLAAPLAMAWLLGRRGLRLSAVQLAVGVALFLATGLQHRMLESNPASPYATAYGKAMFVNLATLWIWLVAPWRAYPDRVASPQVSLVLPALAAAGAGLVAAISSGWRRARPALQAAAWFLALLVPVLPLRSHSYAYYMYLPQIGFLLLIAFGLDHLARWAAGRRVRAAWLLHLAAVVLCAFFAVRNARTHETLMLKNSDVPHDSVVRYARVAGDLVAQVRDAHLPTRIRRLVLFGVSKPGEAVYTPGSEGRGGVHVRVLPMRVVMTDGKIFRLHFPRLQGTFVDSLTERDESPDTAIFFGSGLTQIEYFPDPADAHILLARTQDYLGDSRGCERSLRRALRIAPQHAVARLFLAELLSRSGERQSEAGELLRGLGPESIPDELHPILVKAQQALRAAGRR